MPVIRVVTIESKPGEEENLRRIGRDVLAPLNRRAGCLEVYFLEPSAEDGNPAFGVVSVWKSRDDLIRMKESNEYRELLGRLAVCVESMTDRLFLSA